MVAFAENEIPMGGSGYNADAETQNYYVRNGYYLPTLGRTPIRDGPPGANDQPSWRNIAAARR